MKIQLQQNGDEVGPFSWIEIFVMLQKGVIDQWTPAKLEDESLWQTIDDLGLWREGDEIGPFTWEEISYLVSEGCLDSAAQVRLEGEKELTTLAEASDINESQQEPPGQSDSEAVQEDRIPEIMTWITSISTTFFAAVNSVRLRKQYLLYVVFVLSGFFAGWVLKGSLAESPSKSLQSEVNSASPFPTPESGMTQEPPSAETSIEPLLPSYLENEAPQSVVQVASANIEEAEIGLPVLAPKTETKKLPPEVGEEALPTAPVAETSPGDAQGNQDSSDAEFPLSTSKTEGQTPQVDSSAQLPPPAELPATEQQKGIKIESPKTVVSAAGPASPRLKRLRPFETPQINQQDLEDLLQERFSSVPIKMPGSYDERPGNGLQIHEGSFTLETNLVHNPKVEIIYRVPMHSKHRPGQDADNIVMVGIYHGAIQPRKTIMLDGKEVSEKSRLHGSLAPFADRLGFTAFTMHIATNPEMASDQREYYAYGGPEWVDLVFQAKAEIEKRHKLKERKLLLSGISEGGQFVQNIAAAAPDKVAAISTQSGPNITPPEQPSETAWFLAITRGDGMQSAYEAVYNRLLDQNATVVFNIFPPNYKGRGLGGNFYHSQSELATSANRLFLRGVVDRYDSKKNIDRARWSYVRDRTKPLRIYPSGSSQAKAIPEENKEHLPTRAFAQCLQAIPAPMQSVTLTTNSVRTVKAFVGIPPLGRPKGTIIYAQAFNILDLQHMFDNIYYLAAMGYVVIAPQMRKSDSSDILHAAEFAGKSSVLGKFPMAVMGYGQKANLAWDVVARNRDIAPKAVAMLEFTPRDSLDESKLPPGCRMDVPIVFVYDEYPLVDVATSDEAKKSVEIVSAVKDFVTICNERNQLAKVVIVPKPESKKTNNPPAPEVAEKLERIRVAQLSLEAAERFITKVVENRTSEIEP